MDKDLKHKTVSGVIWVTVQRFGSIAITFIANVILARLLTPADFGCIGMLMIFIGLSNSFIDGGFGSALIQKKKPTEADYSTVFYWNIFLSVVLYWVLYFSAPSISTFYRTPLLTSVLRVEGVVLILNALGIIQLNTLRKYLNFKKLAIVEVASAIVSLAIAIVAAYKGLGVWSLVIQQIALSGFRTILLWIVNTWRPILVFSLKSFRELFSFGSFILLSNLFGALSNEVQGLLVGRMFNPTIMGLYSQAMRLEASMATAVSGVVDQVTYPVMSSLQEERDKLIMAIKRFIQIPAYLCSFAVGLAIVLAKPIIILIYGDQWIAAVPYFQILCVAALAVCLQGSANNSIAAIGKSRVYFRWTIFKRTLTIVLAVVGILFGKMYGLLWMCVLGAWCVYIINAYLVHKHVGYSFWSQIMDIVPFMLLASADGLVVYFLGKVLPFSEMAVSGIQLLVYSILFIAISRLLRIKTYFYIKGLLKEKLARK